MRLLLAVLVCVSTEIYCQYNCLNSELANMKDLKLSVSMCQTDVGTHMASMDSANLLARLRTI